MHIIITIVSLIHSITIIRISNKGLLEECDKEENLEVTGLLLLRV
jgi:hypothetical protein